MSNFSANIKNNKYLFLITLLFFALGFINIHFALLTLVCMSLPLILLFKNKKKTWCQGYCPRSGLYNTVGKLKPYDHIKTPVFFVKGKMKLIILAYFCLSLFVLTMSTIMVAKGKREAMDYIRFLIVFPVSNLPQLFTISSPQWLIHLSYRFYSMMFTTTTLGFIMALIYKPRTWCTVCPIATVSDLYIKSIKKEAS